MEMLFLQLSVALVPALLAVTCHEVCHGYIADRLGDHTARYLGRLTLNPLKHLDILGTIMIFVANIGWAKPVPVNFANLRRPRIDMILVAAAGPATNFILAVASALLLRGGVAVAGGVPSFVASPLFMMLAFSVFINLVLGLFNLVPIPPLDGGRVLVGLLPRRLSALYARIEPVGMILILLVVVFFPQFLWGTLEAPLLRGLDLLVGPEALKYLAENTPLPQLGIFPISDGGVRI